MAMYGLEWCCGCLFCVITCWSFLGWACFVSCLLIWKGVGLICA